MSAPAGTSAPQPPWAAADPVGDALHGLRMTGVYYCRSELSAPWGFSLPAVPDCLWFHAVTAGRCVLDAGGTRAELAPGDLVLVPRGDGHDLGAEATGARPSVLTLAHESTDGHHAVLRAGGGGARTTMVCGAVRLDHPAARALLELLPALLHVPAAAAAGGVSDVLRLLAAEVEQVRPAGEAVLTRLADVLVVQAVRHWLDTAPAAREGWLGALVDPVVGPALALVHRDPAREWTVASLAAAVCVSRSTFAARFTAVAGEPVMQHVTRWRMHVALERLRSPEATVAAVAHQLGYRSEAAFSRAFTRVVGQPPGRAALALRGGPAAR